MPRRHLLAFLLAVAIAAGIGSTDGRAAFPGTDGLIAFQSSRSGGNHDIWTIAPDGSDATRLTDDPAEDWVPAFSADGSKIAFTRGWTGVWVMNSDGSGETRLGDGAYPAWSPDGSRIAYANGGLWVMNADGSGARPLTFESDSQPAWSPDGSAIAVTRGGSSVYVVAADGTGARQVASGYQPDWSPDGSKLALASSQGIRVVDVATGHVTQLTTNGYDEDPAFSPDGSRIVFTSGGRVDNYELFVMNADGSAVSRLTNEFPAYDAAPSWQPVVAPPRPELSLGDARVIEGSSGATAASFEVTLSSASSTAVEVAFATADGTATAPDDYAAASGTLTFAAGETRKTIAVSVAGDSFDEADETFYVDLSAPANAALGDAQGVGTIVDDDAPVARGHTLVGTVSTLTSFAPGAGSLADRLPLAGVRVSVDDGLGKGGGALATTTSDAAGAFALSGLPPCGPRGCTVTFTSGRVVHGSEVVDFSGRASVTRLDALVRRLPERSFLGGSIELLGGGRPEGVEVRVFADDPGARGGGAVSSGVGSPGDWRLELETGKAAPDRVRVVLFADGVPVDEEVVRLEGLETRVPALQVPAVR